jgi:cellulose synthase/poly-beta-1,6-N-acetylglucosamine synthase-like glycosyltransferase
VDVPHVVRETSVSAPGSSLQPFALALVVPCYNEQEVLSETIARLSGVMDRLLEQQRITVDSRIWFVDDGSRDRTWALIEPLGRRHQAGAQSRSPERVDRRSVHRTR